MRILPGRGAADAPHGCELDRPVTSPPPLASKGTSRPKLRLDASRFRPDRSRPLSRLSMHRSRLAPATAALLLGLAACGGDRSRDSDTLAADAPVAGGSLVWTVSGAPGALQPLLLETVPSKQLTDLIFERLAEIRPSLNTLGSEEYDPMLAREWSWGADSLSITFRLSPEARWHDGRPVTSRDVRFTVEAVTDPRVGSTDGEYFAAVDSVSTPDSLTATFWFSKRYPEQFYDAAARLSIIPEHLLGTVPRDSLRFHPFGSAPVGSGRWRFVRAEAGRSVELAANEQYHLGRPHLDRVVMTVVTDPTTATTQLMAGEADLYEMLRPENMSEVSRSELVTSQVVPGTAYSFMAFNFRDPADLSRPHPILADLAMRRALAMAVDRQRVVRGIFDTLAAVGMGPFPRALPVADTTHRPPHFTAAGAAALLDSLGWRDADGDGVREKDGRPLRLRLIVTTSSSGRVRLATALQQQYAAVGVDLDVRQMEFQAFVAAQRARDWDVTLGSWVLMDGSPSGLRNTWRTNGKQNAGRYANAAFDAQVDSGNAEFDPARRRAHFSRAFAIVAEDPPAVWLYEPHNAFGLSRRIVTPELRSVGWWLDLHEWWIPADRRLGRDTAARTIVARQ